MQPTIPKPDRLLGNVSALLFDLGGVVIDIDFNRAFAHWLPMSRLSLAELKSAFTFDVNCNCHWGQASHRGQVFQLAIGVRSFNIIY